MLAEVLRVLSDSSCATVTQFDSNLKLNSKQNMSQLIGYECLIITNCQ